MVYMYTVFSAVGLVLAISWIFERGRDSPSYVVASLCFVSLFVMFGFGAWAFYKTRIEADLTGLHIIFADRNFAGDQMSKRLTCMSLACAVALIVSACTASDTAPPDTTVVATSDSAPVVSKPEPSAAASTSRAPAAEGGDCPDLEFAEAGDPEAVAGWKPQAPVDGGPREFANGMAILDDVGTPVAYTVAAGDVGDFIAERFCVNLSYLNAINGVRRNGATNLHPGDTLNLDAHTILSVGDEQGVVLQNRPPSPMPPQR